MAKRHVEVFTAGCPVCDPTVALIKELSCPSCEVTIYDLNKGCQTNECRDKAKTYGITKVPSVAVDGKIVSCCQSSRPNRGSLMAAGIGKAI